MNLTGELSLTLLVTQMEPGLEKVYLNTQLQLLLSKFLFLDVNTLGLLEGKGYVHSMKVNLVELVLIEVIFKK